MLARLFLVSGLLCAALFAEAREVAQLRLSTARIQSFIAAQPDLAVIARQIGDGPQSPKIQAELERISRKHGFSSFAELDDTAYSISLVLGQIDLHTGGYVDARASFLREIESVKNDPSISPRDRAELIDELNRALEGIVDPLPANIKLVVEYAGAIRRALE